MEGLEYRKNMNHNYLAAKRPEQADYQLEMLTDNRISGLLGLFGSAGKHRSESLQRLVIRRTLMSVSHHTIVPIRQIWPYNNSYIIELQALTGMYTTYLIY